MAFHHLGNLAEIKYACVGGVAVYLVGCGHKHHVDTGFVEQLGIGLLGTGICCQVVGIVKLGGVYKNADNDKVVFAACAFNKRKVACVECTHRGYKADCFALGTGGSHTCLEVGYCSRNFHFSIMGL